MKLETERLIITEFDLSMAEDVHKNSLDEDNKRFVPDEVFETIEEAKEIIQNLICIYKTKNGPLVYPIFLKNNTNIGYVQLIPTKEDFEVGYHIASSYTNKGYATEALNAFISHIKDYIKFDKLYGICLYENIASKRVLEKCGFKKIYEGTSIYQGKNKYISKYLYLIK